MPARERPTQSDERRAEDVLPPARMALVNSLISQSPSPAAIQCRANAGKMPKHVSVVVRSILEPHLDCVWSLDVPRNALHCDTHDVDLLGPAE